MSITSGPKIVNDNLVFSIDMYNTAKSWKGKPTVNLLPDPVLEPSIKDERIDVATSDASIVLPNTNWYYGRFPTTSLSADGGATWDPDIEDPIGGKGAWMMKVRPGGNSETQFYPIQGVGSINQTLTYIVSVYCKAWKADIFRIHLNVTKDGASSWANASGYHTGSGEWERLTVTLPANTGITSINVVRGQAIGSTKTADAYFKYFQVEQSDIATPFVKGERTATNAITDLSGLNTVTIDNLTYNSDNTFSFDGITNQISFPDTDTVKPTNAITINQWFKAATVNDGTRQVTLMVGRDTNSGYTLWEQSGAFTVRLFGGSVSTFPVSAGQWYNVMVSYEGGVGGVVYVNGQLEATLADRGLIVYPEIYGTGPSIGAHGSIYEFEGEIPITQIYNRALTDDELLDIFEAQRSRFEI